MKTTIISHFYNEEYLLPYWLKHHVRLFDDGILIDYESTDKSLEIIREIAPHWKVIPSRNKYYSRPALDPEVVDIEKTIDGWKTCLNTTEFIFHPDLKKYLASLPLSVNGVWLPPISLIDEDPLNPLNPDIPLVLQKHFGVISKNEVRPTNRLIHRKNHGEWKGEGRHDSYMENTFIAGDIFHCWLGYCPWREEFIKRKLQIQDKMSAEYKETKAKEEVGYHLTTREKLNDEFQYKQHKYCKNLFGDPVYHYLWKEIELSYNKKNYEFNPFLASDEIEYNLQRLSSQIKSTNFHSEHMIVIRELNEQRCLFNTNFTQGSNWSTANLNMCNAIYKYMKMHLPRFKFMVWDKVENRTIIDSDSDI